MARFRTIRAIRQIGGAVYCVLPPLARRELRLMIGDYVTVDLDTEAQTITLKAVYPRAEVPMIGFKQAQKGMKAVDAPNVAPADEGPDMTPVLQELEQ